MPFVLRPASKCVTLSPPPVMTMPCVACWLPVRAGASAPATISRPFSSPTTKAGRQDSRQIQRIKSGESSLDDLFALEKPTIAAVGGPAVGYGMDIALYCDIRFASENAKFGWYFVRRGVLGTVGGTFILRQLVGLSKAFELTLTGDLVDADEALRIGLVSRVVPQESLLEEARTMARKLASGPPLAQRAVKRAMHKGFQMDWKSLGEYQQALGDVLWRTDDHREGVNSFVEKRDPKFTGR